MNGTLVNRLHPLTTLVMQRTDRAQDTGLVGGAGGVNAQAGLLTPTVEPCRRLLPHRRWYVGIGTPVHVQPFAAVDNVCRLRQRVVGHFRPQGVDGRLLVGIHLVAVLGGFVRASVYVQPE